MTTRMRVHRPAVAAPADRIAERIARLRLLVDASLACGCDACFRGIVAAEARIADLQSYASRVAGS